MLRQKGNATQGMHSLKEFVPHTMLNLPLRYLRNSNIPEAAMKTKYYVLPGLLRELQQILLWSVGGVLLISMIGMVRYGTEQTLAMKIE